MYNFMLNICGKYFLYKKYFFYGYIFYEFMDYIIITVKGVRFVYYYFKNIKDKDYSQDFEWILVN